MFKPSLVTYLILNSYGGAGYFGTAALEHGEHLWEWKALLARQVPRHNAALKEPRTAVELDAIPGVGFTSFLSPALHITCRVDGGFFVKESLERVSRSRPICYREGHHGTLKGQTINPGTREMFRSSL